MARLIEAIPWLAAIGWWLGFFVIGGNTRVGALSGLLVFSLCYACLVTMSSADDPADDAQEFL